MITPTVGRIVWYRPSAHDQLCHAGPEPLAAIITRVWSDRMVNLTVFDANGFPHNRTSVPLMQDGDPARGDFYCEWMPFQKGQAAKTEAAEKTALELGGEVRRLGLAG